MIGGNISISSGTDSVTMTGGTVAGDVLLGFGNDQFSWNGGGIIYGKIDLGPDNDTAVLANLTDANIGATKQLTGGEGSDVLTFSNVKPETSPGLIAGRQSTLPMTRGSYSTMLLH